MMPVLDSTAMAAAPRLILLCLLFAWGAVLARAEGAGKGANQDRPELVFQTGHTLKVNALVFGPGNRWLASGGSDNTLKIWEVATGRELRTLTGHIGWIKSLAVSADGRLLASGGNDKTIRIWDVLTGREAGTLGGHAGAVESLAFSPDGGWLASGGTDAVVKIWNLATGREARTLTGHAGTVTALAFSPDGQFVASGGADATVRLWDASTWGAARTLKKHTDKVTSVAFSRDGQWLASSSADKTVRVWKVSNGRERFTLTAHGSAVLRVGFGAGGKLISGAVNRVVKFWNTSTGKEERTVGADSGLDKIDSIAFSGDGVLSASGNGGRTIEVHSLAGVGGPSLTLDSRSSGFYAVAFSPDGRWLAAGGNDRSVRLWDLTTGRAAAKLTGHTGWVTTVAFSPDSRRLAAGSMSGLVKVWDLATGLELFSLAGHQRGVDAIAFSPNGKLLASASADQTIRLWDTSAGRESKTLTGHGGEVTTVAFSPDGRWLASGSVDKTVRLWDYKTANQPRVLASAEGQIQAVSFSRDGRMLAAGGEEKAVKILEVDTGRVARTLVQNEGATRTLSFSADGCRLAAGGADKTVRLWEVASTAPESKMLNSHSGGVNSLAFSADGRWLASGSNDGSVVVWDSAGGSVQATLMSMRETDDWLVASPNGLFDGSPAAWNSILWRFDRSTFKVASVEAFFNEFYYPGLLAEVVAGKSPQPAQDITQKDRRQPQVKLTLAEAAQTSQSLAARSVNVRVEISEAPPDQKHTRGGGARDLRLFRNGSLIKAWRGDLSDRAFEVSIPIVAGQNRLSAYAFNQDNVKSGDAELTVTGAENLRRAGTLYVLAVGINEYANREFNLRYAVPDAADFGEELKRQQDLLRVYDRTEVVALYDEQAKKQSILDALSAFSKRMQPEDAVVIYFAGHGTVGTCQTESSRQVNARDRFYLVPHDLGYAGAIPAQCDQRMLSEVTSHSISDEELEGALEGVDAGQILLVIDACNSGQALESEEKRRGPMNSKGLAQLAYEKGMYILTAAQSFQVAKADKKIAKGHGYLTYALVEEGLKTFSADEQPEDGQVVLREWLDYAARRVPLMQQAEAQERRQFVKRSAAKDEEEEVQQPRVFYRSEAGLKPFVVAARGQAGPSVPK